MIANININTHKSCKLTPPIPRTASVALLMIPTAVAIVLNLKYFHSTLTNIFFSNQHKYFFLHLFIYFLAPADVESDLTVLYCVELFGKSSSHHTVRQVRGNTGRRMSHELISRPQLYSTVLYSVVQNCTIVH